MVHQPLSAESQMEALPSAAQGNGGSLIPLGHYAVGGRIVPCQDLMEQAVRTLLMGVGEDPRRGGLVETPKRFVAALREYCSGYGIDPASILKCFEDGAEGYNEMVTESGIPFYSLCEHHLAPFFGHAHISYIPTKKVVGLSKLPRLLEVFSRRLQVQERLTVQIAEALMEHLQPLGVGVIIDARHLCMECRGVRKPDVTTRTCALRGVFFDKPEVRAEFLSICIPK